MLRYKPTLHDHQIDYCWTMAVLVGFFYYLDTVLVWDITLLYYTLVLSDDKCRSILIIIYLIIDRVASAPGKVLMTGGYLILERPNAGIVLSTNARFYAIVKPLYEEIRPDSWAWVRDTLKVIFLLKLNIEVFLCHCFPLVGFRAWLVK